MDIITKFLSATSSVTEEEIITKIKELMNSESVLNRKKAITENRLNNQIIDEIKFYIKVMAIDALEITEGWQLMSQQKYMDECLPISKAILTVFFNGDHNVLGRIFRDEQSSDRAISQAALNADGQIIRNINFIDQEIKFVSNSEEYISKIDYKGNIEIFKANNPIYSFRAYNFYEWDSSNEPHMVNELKVFRPGMWIIDFLLALAETSSKLKDYNERRSDNAEKKRKKLQCEENLKYFDNFAPID